MPTVIATHEVKDKDHWLASPKRDEIFATVGVTGVRTFVDPTNPHFVGIMADVPDMDALQAMLESPEGKAAEDHDGVLAETIKLLIET